jgi:hypothetical protein
MSWFAMLAGAHRFPPETLSEMNSFRLGDDLRSVPAFPGKVPIQESSICCRNSSPSEKAARGGGK